MTAPMVTDLDLVGVWDLLVDNQKHYELALDPQHNFVHGRADQSVVVWGSWALLQLDDGHPALALRQRGAHPASGFNPVSPWHPSWVILAQERDGCLPLGNATLLQRRTGDLFEVLARMTAMLRVVHPAPGADTAPPVVAPPTAPALLPASAAHGLFDGGALLGMWSGHNGLGDACSLLIDAGRYLFYYDSYRFAHWGSWYLEAVEGGNPLVQLAIEQTCSMHVHLPAGDVPGQPHAASLELHALQGDKLWLQDLVMTRDDSLLPDQLGTTIDGAVAYFRQVGAVAEQRSAQARSEAMR